MEVDRERTKAGKYLIQLIFPSARSLLINHPSFFTKEKNAAKMYDNGEKFYPLLHSASLIKSDVVL